MLLRVWRFLRALLIGVSKFARQEPVVTLVLLVAVPVAAGSLWTAAHETPQEASVRRAAEAGDAAQIEIRAKELEEQGRALEEHNQQIRGLCRLKDICAQFSKVRQECATAGSFNNCISVKMGDERYGDVGSCTNNGNIGSVAPENVPSRLECLTN